MVGKTIHVDESRWPLVTVRFIGDCDENEFEAYLRFLDRNLARTTQARTKNAFMFDAREVGRVSANIRRMQADWMKANEAASKQNCSGFAYVLESAITRGILTAILWLVPMPAPHVVVATVFEAESWLTARLGEHGVRVPPPRLMNTPVRDQQR